MKETGVQGFIKSFLFWVRGIKKSCLKRWHLSNGMDEVMGRNLLSVPSAIFFFSQKIWKENGMKKEWMGSEKLSQPPAFPFGDLGAI